MVVKKYRDLLHVEFPPSKMTFNQRTGGNHVFYDKHLLEANLPPTTGVMTADKTLLKSLGNVLPDGTRSLIPAAWTDIKEQASDRPLGRANDGSSTLLGSVLHLLHARKVVDALLGDDLNDEELRRLAANQLLDLRQTMQECMDQMLDLSDQMENDGVVRFLSKAHAVFWS